MEISAKTRLAGLIGHPVEHSFSPYIHNFLAEKFGVDLKYMALDVAPNRVDVAVKGIGALGLIGSNVTIPHKIAVMKSLDEIDPHAAVIGAVNTIKNNDGKLIGYNTDGAGFVKSVKDEGHEVKGACAMVLGAGGASRAITVALAAAGAHKIIIRNHTLAKAEALAADIQAAFPKVSVTAGSLALTADQLEGVDFLINTTPLGMSTRKNECPIEEDIVPPSGLVACDIVYTPYETRFIKWAERNGLQTVHGIGMLIHQALCSFTIWTGIETSTAYQEVFDLLVQKGVIL